MKVAWIKKDGVRVKTRTYAWNIWTCPRSGRELVGL